MKKEDRYAKAADIHLKLGQFKDFCELQKKLGNYEKALAFAPKVSLAYWEECLKEYTKSLEAEPTEELV